MLIWNPSVLTANGKALLAKAQAGRTSIKITKAQTGSGSYASGENLEVRTALKNRVQEFPISDKSINNDSTLILKITISNKNETSQLANGYEIKEFGIFAMDPDKGEILYSIATAKTSDYMPAYNGEIPAVINMSYYLEVANAANVVINSQGALALASDVEALETRVYNLENNGLQRYGARKKVEASSNVWERIGGAVGLVARAAVGTEIVQNDFMTSVYPYNKIRPCNVANDMSVNAYLGDADFQWDGTNGDVMVEIPLFYSDRYFETDPDGVKWEYRWISAGPVNGLHIHPLFIDGDRISEKVYLPIFNGSLSADGTKLESKSGAFPLHNKTRDQFRALCTSKGTKWCLDDVWAMHALDQLYIVMYSNSHAQGTLGAGRTEMPYNKANGTALQERSETNYITIVNTWAANFQVGQGIGIGTDVGSASVCIDRIVTKIIPSTEIENASCVYFDGDPVNITTSHCTWSCCQPTGATITMASANGRCEGVNGRSAIRFLYIEDWYGNGWQFRDGDNIKTWQHYYCNKRSSYADRVHDRDYFKVGYEASQTNGYVKKFGYDQEYPEIDICTDATAGSTTHFCDYYYQAEGGEVVLSGGHVYNGTSAGPFYRTCADSAGTSSWALLGRPQGRK